MAKIVWAEPALINLDEIAEYIALDKPQAARKLVQSVFDNTDKLKDHPRIGRKAPELENSVYRELIVGPCRVFYRSDKNTIYILHVMGSEMLLRKYILSERSGSAR